MNLEEPGSELEYNKIFQQRGNSYHRAMQACPRARDLEFSSLFIDYPLLQNELIIDIPSGGGYLGQFINRKWPNNFANIHSFEVTNGFTPDIKVVDKNLIWPVKPQAADRIICLAAMHHFNEIDGFLKNCRNALRTDGFLHIADVSPNSRVQDFLESFVHQYTPGGHRGIYRDFDAHDWPLYFRLSKSQRYSCPWKFISEDEMLTFCEQLFGLLDVPKAALREALHDIIGVVYIKQGVELAWELDYLTLTKVF